jgi:hypothetical protein
LNMNDEALLQVLRETKRTAGAISGLAAQLADISQKDLTPLMQILIDQGEDKARGILLNVVAWQRMHVTPEILCKSLKVVDNIDDFTYQFREQDGGKSHPAGLYGRIPILALCGVTFRGLFSVE